MAAAALGRWGLGLWFLAAAFANRMIQSIVVGWWLMKDPRTLKYSWLYPLRDLQGFGVWVASFLSHNFYWRGEMYRFTKDGRIIAQTRTAETSPTATET